MKKYITLVAFFRWFSICYYPFCHTDYTNSLFGKENTLLKPSVQWEERFISQTQSTRDEFADYIFLQSGSIFFRRSVPCL